MSSVPMIESVAASLGELRERFVFVGEAVLELLITDPTVIDFRPTTDVDLVVEVTTYGSYASVEQTVADRGFTRVVGPDVMRTAHRYMLPSGLEIRLTAPQYFVATKLEAFRTRGNGDARLSYDMEDIIAVLDGRSGIEEEFVASSPAVRSHIAVEFRKLSTDTATAGDMVP